MTKTSFGLAMSVMRLFVAAVALLAAVSAEESNKGSSAPDNVSSKLMIHVSSSLSCMFRFVAAAWSCGGLARVCGVVRTKVDGALGVDTLWLYYVCHFGYSILTQRGTVAHFCCVVIVAEPPLKFSRSARRAGGTRRQTEPSDSVQLFNLYVAQLNIIFTHLLTGQLLRPHQLFSRPSLTSPFSHFSLFPSSYFFRHTDPPLALP